MPDGLEREPFAGKLFLQRRDDFVQSKEKRGGLKGPPWRTPDSLESVSPLERSRPWQLSDQFTHG